ncbi:MAG: hypothetical protein KIC98_06950 [Clostridioides difficile]|nr:hypothetical protein [Clostridioides sp.]MBS5787632.1 hypothetical protein [Clostridioides difficile]
MESIINRDELKKMILDMAQKELKGYTSQKGSGKYFEGNLEKIIDKNISKFKSLENKKKIYSRILNECSNQKNSTAIAKTLKRENLFRTKKELFEFSKSIGVEVHGKLSYSNLMRRVSNHIYLNKNFYSDKYILLKRGEDEYVLEPKLIKEELIESYKSKTRGDMKNIAKMLNIDTDEESSAEDIRRKIINSIVRDKMSNW